MGFGHRYELVKEGDDIKDEPQDTSSEPQRTSTELQRTSTGPQRTKTLISLSWWKFLLCNLLAASVGAGAMFLVARCFLITQPSGNSTDIAAASPTISTGLTLPTLSVEHVEEDVGNPSDLSGKILECGYSPEEARNNGCVYDVMMQDWVPEPCYDSVLTEKYLAEGNYTWYGDGDGNTTISLEDMRKGEHGAAWMATSYHKAHCVFSWNKIIRALRNNRGISQELLSYDHVLHCSMGALKADSDDEGLGVRAPTNYAKCALYETWKHDFIPDKHNSTQR